VENRIALELKALLSAHLPLAKLYYWRTTGGAEVDLVVERDGRLIPIEVKWSEQVSKRDLKGLESLFNDMGPDVPWGMVLYRGKQVVKLSEKLFLVPFERVVS
jgi:predicted AAA+ superfamily ATPase